MFVCLSFFPHSIIGPPGAPQNIRITHRLEGFIINWDPLRNDLIRYDFQLTTSENKVLLYSIPETTDPQVKELTHYEIRNLQRGKQYTLKMRAIDRNIQIGEWSNANVITTVTESAPYVDKRMPNATSVGEGLSQAIKCNIRGEPLPQIEWTKDGVKIQNNMPAYKINNDEGELVLVNPVRNALNGIYQCKGTNKYGSIQNNPTRVTVECKSFLQLCKYPNKISIFHSKHTTFIL